MEKEGQGLATICGKFWTIRCPISDLSDVRSQKHCTKAKEHKLLDTEGVRRFRVKHTSSLLETINVQYKKNKRGPQSGISPTKKAAGCFEQAVRGAINYNGINKLQWNQCATTVRRGYWFISRVR